MTLDLSGVVLAKYALKDKGEAQLQLSGDDALLKPSTDVGTGQAKDPILATWEENIQQANLPLKVRNWTPSRTSSRAYGTNW